MKNKIIIIIPILNTVYIITLYKKFNQNKKYFNPYEEYDGYTLVALDTIENLPTTRFFEKTEIKYFDEDGMLEILFVKNRFIIAFDFIEFFITNQLPIWKIYFNNHIIFENNKCFYITGGNNDNKVHELGKITKIIWKQWDAAAADALFLTCEELLQTKNKIIIYLQENEHYLRDQTNLKFSKYETLSSYLFYKSTKEFDNEYFLRETLDEWKIK